MPWMFHVAAACLSVMAVAAVMTYMVGKLDHDIWGDDD